MTTDIKRSILSLPGNDRCMDCYVPCPSWSSLTHGTVLCLKCAGIHRGLGVHVSFVRSLVLDSWSESQIDIMLAGGNHKCREFLKCNGYNEQDGDPDQERIKERYTNSTAKCYRETLKAGVEVVQPSGDEIDVTPVSLIHEKTEVIDSSIVSHREEQRSKYIHASLMRSLRSTLQTAIFSCCC